MELIQTNQNREEIELFYNSLEQTDANFLKAKEFEIVRIGNSYLTDLGKIFKEAQDKLSNSKDGVFVNWIKHLEISHQTVYNLINRYDFVFKNFENQNLIESLPKSLSYEISKPSASKEAVNSVMNGETKTLKEYKQFIDNLKSENDSLNQDKIRLQQEYSKSQLKIRELENREPEIITKEIEKEIQVIQYKDSPELLKRINQLTASKQELESKIKSLSEIEKHSQDIERAKQELDRLQNECNSYQKDYDSLKEVFSFISRTKNFIKTEMLHIPTLTLPTYNQSEVFIGEITMICETLNNFSYAIKQQFLNNQRQIWKTQP